MKKFNLSAKVTISISTVVEANSLEEALKIANEREGIEKYDSWEHDEENESWIADEYDGAPFDIYEVK